MTFTPALDARIRDLGGEVRPAEGSLENRLRAVDFASAPALLFSDAFDYAEEEQFAALADAPDDARDIVRYPTLDWEVERFTPFTPGTDDHEHWAGAIDDRALVAAGGVAGATVLFIGTSEGWPNHFFVLAEDPTPDDPIVFTTDAENYFGEVEAFGTLNELLDAFFTDEELSEAVARELASD